MHRAMELAWESFRAGSLGIGAVITRDGETCATGRNRLAESDPATTSSRATRSRTRELEHARQAAMGIAVGRPRAVDVAAAVPAVPRRHSPESGAQGARTRARPARSAASKASSHLNEFIGRQWPEIVERPVDEWAALSLLFHTHVTTFWQASIDGWNQALPSVAALAAALVASGELLDLAASEVDLDHVADALWSRLSECVPDVAALT